MDPISHIALGASLSYAAFSRQLGRTAAWAGGLAAFVPDADVFIRSAADPLLGIEYHRHFTHALVFAPLGAALVAALWLTRARWRPHALTLWLACLLAYVSHCLLDAATSYGTLLWWPFSDRRVGWDFISIIDPVFTLPLLAGLAIGLLRQRLVLVKGALALALGYLTLGAIQCARASAAQEALARQRGHTIERAEVMPTMANNVVWRALYLHDGRIYSDRIRVGWFSRPTVIEGWSLPQVTAADLLPEEVNRDRHRSFARFAWFSEGWVARKPTDPTVLADMRYSLSAEAFDPIWGIRFLAPEAPVDVEWVNRSRDRRIPLADLWQEITGRDARYRPLAALAVATP